MSSEASVKVVIVVSYVCVWFMEGVDNSVSVNPYYANQCSRQYYSVFAWWREQVNDDKALLTLPVLPVASSWDSPLWATTLPLPVT